jgi:hypothetical protein
MSELSDGIMRGLQEMLDHAEGKTSRLKLAPDGTVIGVEYSRVCGRDGIPYILSVKHGHSCVCRGHPQSKS